MDMKDKMLEMMLNDQTPGPSNLPPPPRPNPMNGPGYANADGGPDALYDYYADERQLQQNARDQMTAQPPQPDRGAQTSRSLPAYDYGERAGGGEEMAALRAQRDKLGVPPGAEPDLYMGPEGADGDPAYGNPGNMAPSTGTPHAGADTMQDDGNIAATVANYGSKLGMKPDMVEAFLDSPQFEEALQYWEDGQTDVGIEMLYYKMQEFQQGVTTGTDLFDGRPAAPFKGDKGDLPTSDGYDFGAEFPGTEAIKQPSGKTATRPDNAEPAKGGAYSKSQSRLTPATKPHEYRMKKR